MIVKDENEAGAVSGSRIIIEPGDLMNDGEGVDIMVQGFKGSPEDDDECCTHIYIERWKGETKIMVWNNTVTPATFVLVKSEENPCQKEDE